MKLLTIPLCNFMAIEQQCRNVEAIQQKLIVPIGWNTQLKQYHAVYPYCMHVQ